MKIEDLKREIHHGYLLELLVRLKRKKPDLNESLPLTEDARLTTRHSCSQFLSRAYGVVLASADPVKARKIGSALYKAQNLCYFKDLTALLRTHKRWDDIHEFVVDMQPYEFLVTADGRSIGVVVVKHQPKDRQALDAAIRLMEANTDRTMSLSDSGCTCHTGAAPCAFCTSLTENEVDAYASGGMKALKAYWDSVQKQIDKQKRLNEALNDPESVKKIEENIGYALASMVYQYPPLCFPEELSKKKANIFSNPAVIIEKKRVEDPQMKYLNMSATIGDKKPIKEPKLVLVNKGKTLEEMERSRFLQSVDVFMPAATRVFVVGTGRGPVVDAKRLAMAERIAYLEGWSLLELAIPGKSWKVVSLAGKEICKCSSTIDGLPLRMAQAWVCYRAYLSLGGTDEQLDAMIKDLESSGKKDRS